MFDELNNVGTKVSNNDDVAFLRSMARSYAKLVMFLTSRIGILISTWNNNPHEGQWVQEWMDQCPIRNYHF